MKSLELHVSLLLGEKCPVPLSSASLCLSGSNCVRDPKDDSRDDPVKSAPSSRFTVPAGSNHSKQNFIPRTSVNKNNKAVGYIELTASPMSAPRRPKW